MEMDMDTGMDMGIMDTITATTTTMIDQEDSRTE